MTVCDDVQTSSASSVRTARMAAAPSAQSTDATAAIPAGHDHSDPTQHLPTGGGDAPEFDSVPGPAPQGGGAGGASAPQLPAGPLKNCMNVHFFA